MSREPHPYATRAYAETLQHIGTPIAVPEWSTWLIERPAPDGRHDATGPYPLTCIGEDADLARGHERLRDRKLVSVTLVVDGLTGPPEASFRQAFHRARPFKTHYLVDTRAPHPTSRHHSREIERAARRGVATHVVQLRDVLDDWVGLYEGLVERRDLSGATRFPRESFEALCACPGLHAIGGFIAGRLVACHLWFAYRDVVWSHLAASSDIGYANGAAYAVHAESIRFFDGSIVNLGGAAGVADSATDGLALFKRGFANRTQQAWLLGHVLDRPAYEQLSADATVDADADYFPAYRSRTSGGGSETRDTSTSERR